MTSPKPPPSGNLRSFEGFYQPLISRVGVFCAGLVVLLQFVGILSRSASGSILIGLMALLWLLLSVVRRLSDD